MANGEGHWAAIAELRATATKHERELGAITKAVSDAEADIHAIGEDVRTTRHEIRNAMSAMEGRLLREIKAEAESIRVEQVEGRKERLTRVRFWIMVLAPIVCVFLSYLLARSGGA